jgi:hypothetical protein
MKFIKGFLAGFLITVSVSSLAIIGGGIIVHNHSGGASGGNSLLPSTLITQNPGSGSFMGVASGAVGTIADLRFFNNGSGGTSLRWIIRKNSVAETGGNVGSDLEFQAQDDTGGGGFTALRISRASGTLNILTGGLNAPNILSSNSMRASNVADVSSTFGVTGITKGVRIGTTASAGTLDCVDSTLSASFQPCSFTATDWSLVTSGGLGTLTYNASGSLASTKACATNYTRTAPNFCLFTGPFPGSTSITNSCTNIAAPSGSISLYLYGVIIITSTNTLNALDSTVMSVYNDASCTTATQVFNPVSKEFVALAATTIATPSVTMIAPVVTGNARIKGDKAASGTLTIGGYFD